jgi:imidazolonepropionase
MKKLKSYALTHIHQMLTLKGVHQKNGRFLRPQDLGLIKKAAIVVENERILFAGTEEQYRELLAQQQLPQFPEIKLPPSTIVTPEIIDAHTHLVFAGNRAQEYIQRLNGASYQDIAEQGGGIQFTVEQTRQASSEELFRLACLRIEKIISYGVGTLEIKSGYGLTFKDELKISHVIHQLKEHFQDRLHIIRTAMPAHAVGKEYAGKPDHYFHEVALKVMSELAEQKLIDGVDIFVEEGYFNKQHYLLLEKFAEKNRLTLHAHVDEFADHQGALLVTQGTYPAHSAEHLLATSLEGIKKLGASPTVANILPGTALFLGKPFAKVPLMLEHGVKLALSSDFNPGSCHCDNVLLLAQMAAASCKMNIAQLWASITYNAAHALNCMNQGAIDEGLRDKLSFFNANDYSEITYHWGHQLNINQEVLNLKNQLCL